MITNTFVLICVVGVFALTGWIYEGGLAARLDKMGYSDDYTSIVGVINSVAIPVLNVIFKKIAQKITDWEMHRTTDEYNNSIAMKLFCFQFVNSYTSLFFIAFRTRSFDQLQYQPGQGASDVLQDAQNKPACFLR